MDPVEEQLARLSQNPGDWSARAELAHLWREGGVNFDDDELLSGATGAPRDRTELQRLLDALPEPPLMPCWKKFLDEYLQWAPGCPLGLASLARVVEASGESDEAIALYQKAIEIDPSVSEPPLACLPKEEKHPPLQDASRGNLLGMSKFVSMLVAIIAHLILIIVFSLLAETSIPQSPPQLIARTSSEDVSDNLQDPKRISFSPVAATANAQIASVDIVSDMAITLSSPTDPTSSLVLSDDTFSPSMSFGQDSGGSVSFFGSQGKTKNLVFVVDVSGSMEIQGENGKSRVQLMKEELTRSVSALPLSVKYQIIFFSSSAWFAGQEAAGYGIVLPADDPESLPSRSLLRATQSQIRKTLGHIDKVEIGGGTNWRLPLKMAIKLEPDLIYFMTDGEFSSDNGKIPVIDDVVNYNRSKSQARINTICLMELKAYDELQELAQRTRGTVFLVKENGEVLRGLEIEMIK